MDRNKESKGKDTDGVLEKGKEDHQKEKGARSFMGSVRRISLIFVGVGLDGGGGPCIPPVPTSLPPALSCASQSYNQRPARFKLYRCHSSPTIILVRVQ